MHRDAGGSGEPLGHVRREGGTARQHQPHGSEPLTEVLDRQPVGEDRRSDGNHAARLVLDQVERGLRLEALEEHQLGALPKDAAEDRVEPVDVEQGKYAEHDVVGAEHRRVDSGDLLDVGEQRAMAEHRPAGAARRTAGVEECGQRLRVADGRQRGPVGGDQFLPRPLTGLDWRFDDDDARTNVVLVQLRDGCSDRTRGVGVSEHHPRAAVGDHPAQLVDRRTRVDGDGDGLGAKRTEVGGDELDPVAHRDHHPVAGHQAGGAEARRAPTHLFVQLTPGAGPPTSLDEGDLVWVLFGCDGEQLGNTVEVGHGQILPHAHGPVPRPALVWVA